MKIYVSKAAPPVFYKIMEANEANILTEEC
jgi:hypothetical protein